MRLIASYANSGFWHHTYVLLVFGGFIHPLTHTIAIPSYIKTSPELEKKSLKPQMRIDFEFPIIFVKTPKCRQIDYMHSIYALSFHFFFFGFENINRQFKMSRRE